MTLEEEEQRDAHPPARDRSARASEEVRSGREEVSDPLHLSRLSTWLNDHASTPFGREQLKDKPLAEGVELERRLEAAVAGGTLGLDDTPGLHLEADCRPSLDRAPAQDSLTRLNSTRSKASPGC